MKKLFIIGNGFDIAHGLNTRYSDFMKYLNQFEIPPRLIAPMFVDRNSMSKDDIVRHDLYDKISKYISVEDLWYHFEDALGNIDIEQIKDDNSCYLLGYGDDNWKDSAHHDYQYMINEELSFTDEIVYWFCRWLDTINTHVAPKKEITKLIDAEDVFLNFNYTDTLETTYGICENRINYIHGKAGRDSKLILGHHNEEYFKEPVDMTKMSEEEYENYYEYISGIDIREQEADEYIEAYFRRTFKDTLAIIDANYPFFERLYDVNVIYILGHSLSFVDMNYFIKIRKQVGENCIWNISCYSNEDYIRVKDLTQYLQIKYINLLNKI